MLSLSAATRRQSREKDLPPSEEGAVYQVHKIQRRPNVGKEMDRKWLGNDRALAQPS
jgi:hypothetical protein